MIYRFENCPIGDMFNYIRRTLRDCQDKNSDCWHALDDLKTRFYKIKKPPVCGGRFPSSEDMSNSTIERYNIYESQ